MSASLTTSLVTHIDITIGGTLLPGEYLEAIEEVLIDHNRHLPAMAMVRFHMHKPEWLSDAKLAEAKEIKLEAGEQNNKKVLFTGKTVSFALDHDVNMPTITIRAYDHSYALHRVRHRRSFLNMTDSDIASKMAGEASLSPQVESTGSPFEYLFQNNQSNYEFLRERARRIGFDVYVDDKTLNFKKAHATAGTPPTLTWGENLQRFQVKTSTAEPIQKVAVRGWDQKAKREIVGQASGLKGLPVIGDSKKGHQLAVKQDTEFVVTDLWVASANDATSVAQAYLDELGDSFIEAEGRCYGQPDIKPGGTVTLKGVGDRFTGTYYVTGVTHTYDQAEGFMTVFRARSRRAGTVHELLEETRPRKLVQGPLIGIVTNINDPEKKGRIKVWLPTLGDKSGQTPAESHWARLATPLTGAKRGAHFLPEVDDEVLVDFLQGDITQPYIIGGLWNGKDDPPVPVSLPGGRDDQILQGGGAKVKNRLIKSTKGNMLIFCDQDNAPGLFLVGSSGAYIMIDDENGKEKISIKDKTRNNYIEIRTQSPGPEIFIQTEGDLKATIKGNVKGDVTGNTDLKVTGNTDINVTGNLTAKSTGNTNIEATGTLTAKSTGPATVESTATLNVKGMIVTVEATGALTLKGSAVTVQSSGPLALKGTPIAIG